MALKRVYFALIISLILVANLCYCITEEATTISEEMIRARIKEVEEKTGLEKEAKDKQLSTLNSSLEFLRQANEWQGKVLEHGKFLTSAPEMIKSLKNELALVLTKESEVKIPELSIEKMDTILLNCKTEVTQFNKTLSELDTLLNKISEKRTTLPVIITERKKKKEDTLLELSALKSTDIAASHDRFLLMTKKITLEKEINSLEKEILTFDNRQELARLKMEKVAREIPIIEKKIKLFTDKINEVKKNEAAAAEKKAEEELRNSATSHPIVTNLAKGNAELAAKRTGTNGLISRIEKLQSKIESTKKLLKKLDDEFKNIKERVKASGLTNAIGMLLRIRKNDLPDLDRLQKELNENRDKISGIQLELLEYDDIRSQLIHIDQEKEELLKAVDTKASNIQKELIEKNIRELLMKKKEYIEANVNDSNILFARLVDYDTLLRQLSDAVLTYRDYIDERVLWIKSMNPLWTANFKGFYTGASWILKPANWLNFFRKFVAGIRGNLFASISFFIIILFFIISRPKFKKRYLVISEKVKKASTDKLIYTFEAVVHVVILGATWPLILIFIGYFAGLGTGDSFSTSVAISLSYAGLVWFILECVVQLFKTNALAHFHFNWFPEQIHQEIVKFLRKIEFFILPVFFLISLSSNLSNDSIEESIGRVLFVFLLIMSGFFCHRFFRPKGQIITSAKNNLNHNWLYKIRYPLNCVIIIFPVVLVILSLIGYNYTAFQLFTRMFRTILCLTLVAVLYSLLNRVLTVFKRSLAKKKFQDRKKMEEDAPDHPVIEQDDVNIDVIGEQTKKILRLLALVLIILSMWIVWKDIMPALKIFEQVPLWKTKVQVVETSTNANGTSTDVIRETLEDISMFDLFSAILIVILTIIIARNFSGLMEIMFLRHLPLDQGTRFAIRTITTYIITVLGIMAAFNAIGIGWAKVQWLLAAVSVGLGFGLQEIFANFVSGLIILFERPMRIGDVVTIGDVTGSVSKIEIRGTTITNWDRKEIIIPNKEFITSRLMNWTLTDNILRLVFKVGVAYGSDVELVHKLLNDIPASFPDILKEPPHIAIFTGFGDSSLNFELRIFIDDIGCFVKLSDKVYSRIDAEFRKHDVEIPFPQRDLHVRSVDEKISFDGMNNCAPVIER